MPDPAEPQGQSYSPWTIVNLVFHHLVDQGLRPTLGEGGDPGPHAAQLLLSLGVQPAARDQRQVMERQQQLADLRAAVFDQPEA